MMRSCNGLTFMICSPSWRKSWAFPKRLCGVPMPSAAHECACDEGFCAFVPAETWLCRHFFPTRCPSFRSAWDWSPSNADHRGSRWDSPQLARSDRAGRSCRVVRRTMALRADGFMGRSDRGPRLGPVGAHPATEDRYSDAGWLSSGKLSRRLYTADHSQTVHNGTLHAAGFRDASRAR
jgi:hypothetical protein